jgi:hypothetical protein
MLQARKKFWGKRPGFDFGDVIHLAVTVIFASVLFVMVRYWDVTILAIILVILSKWRVLAVQPRFWLPNVKANAVDMIVGISSVLLMQQASAGGLAVSWALLYAAWLLFVKPQTSDVMVGVQALWALLIGLITVFNTNFLLNVSFLGIALAWLVAWSSARHFLSNYEEPHYKILSLVWAFLIAQITWLGFHWINYYQVSSLKIANVALISSVLAATVGVLYNNYRAEKLHKSIVLENVIFGAALLVIILITSAWSTRL